MAGPRGAGLPGVLLAVLSVLGGCGQAVDDKATPGRVGSGVHDQPSATPQAAVAPPLAAPVAAAAPAPADWAVTALLPQGDIDLPDGRVERGYRVVLSNGPLERAAVLLQLQAAPPGVEVVRGTVALDELPTRAQLSPPGTVLLRHPPELALNPNLLQWALQDAPAAASGVQGRLLAGPAAQSALAAVVGHQAAADPQPRAQLLVHLPVDATVDAVNQALRLAGVRIVQMRVGNHGLTLRPLARDAGAAARAQQQLQGSAVFSAVWLQAAPPTPAVVQIAEAARLPTDCAD